jgi:hypothetical protein
LARRCYLRGGNHFLYYIIMSVLKKLKEYYG